MTNNEVKTLGVQLDLFGPVNVAAEVRAQMSRPRLTSPSTFQFPYPPQPAPIFNAGLADRKITPVQLGEELAKVYAARVSHPVCQGTSAIYDKMKSQKEQRELVDGALDLARSLALTREETRQMLGLDATTDSLERAAGGCQAVRCGDSQSGPALDRFLARPVERHEGRGSGS
jgi:hypothetical protein